MDETFRKGYIAQMLIDFEILKHEDVKHTENWQVKAMLEKISQFTDHLNKDAWDEIKAAKETLEDEVDSLNDLKSELENKIEYLEGRIEKYEQENKEE